MKLPPNWVQITEEPSVLCQLVVMNGNAEVRVMVMIQEDLSWKCSYYDQEVKATCCVISSLPFHITCVRMVSKLITTLTENQICIGNHDEDVMTMSGERKGKFVNSKGDTIARIDSKHISCNDQLIPNTIRHMNCEIFIAPDITNNRCKQCQTYRPVLRAMYHRFKQKRLPSMLSSSHINNKYLSSPEKITKLSECQASLRATKHQLSQLQMQQSLISEVAKNGIQLHNDIHNDLVSIMQEKAEEIQRGFPNDSFRQLFWKQQFEAAVKSNPKQMRWHPLMIKWCLSIKLKSSTTYETLYNSGLLKLPSQRTLRDYTHVIKPSSGFSNDIDDMIVKEAKLGELEEWQKHVVLIFDEMHIKEDLIFDKLTGELKGFINLGNINDHLLRLESSSTEQTEHHLPDLANSVLTFMVRGIFINLHFPYAQFPCKNLTGDELYPLVWEAIQRLELCGFKVLATICDGAANNRRFIHMHGTPKSSLVYKTKNPYSMEKGYFMIDVPHLMKTARNCWSNPKTNL